MSIEPICHTQKITKTKLIPPTVVLWFYTVSTNMSNFESSQLKDCWKIEVSLNLETQAPMVYHNFSHKIPTCSPNFFQIPNVHHVLFPNISTFSPPFLVPQNLRLFGAPLQHLGEVGRGRQHPDGAHQGEGRARHHGGRAGHHVAPGSRHLDTRNGYGEFVGCYWKRLLSDWSKNTKKKHILEVVNGDIKKSSVKNKFVIMIQTVLYKKQTETYCQLFGQQ